MLPMSVNTLVGKSLDRLFQEVPECAPFTKQKGTGPHLRRFYHATESTQREIVFYRDKLWTATGGVLYAEIYCLVQELQYALHGRAQSLLTPDFSIPFSHFQYVLSERNPKRSWALNSLDDVTAFEQEMKDWLPSIALPWLGQFESHDGVVRHLQLQRQFVKLAEYLAHRGDEQGASLAVAEWVGSLPRRTENCLRKLASKGLISTADEEFLAKASIQSEEDYRRQTAVWLARRAIRTI